MATSYFTRFGINEVQYFLDYIKNHIAEYKLSELTSGYAGDVPSINGAHPLAMEYGNMMAAAVAGSENYTSVLPAIGVEFIDDNENDPQLLGAGFKMEEVTQDFIDAASAIASVERINNGLILSESVLQAIKDSKEALDPEKLYGRVENYLQASAVNISIWSDHIDVTRYTYLVVRSLLKRAKRDLSRNRGVKNLKIDGSGAIYNYEFGKTLFGAEFHLSFLQLTQNVEVDGTVSTIKKVEEVEQTGLEMTNTPGNTFKGKGG